MEFPWLYSCAYSASVVIVELLPTGPSTLSRTTGSNWTEQETSNLVSNIVVVLQALKKQEEPEPKPKLGA